ncbi:MULTISPECIES: anti-phage-associated helicase HerA [unclassified Psychrobacter]|uniref:anti-phage-associated helicase HerA n=1 Tax=unclassified Psychrobacter TaxID=196806 RepID=UPI000412815A|nr:MULTISPECIES: anti-phage-associated helicase HerA [unclassified Psychrobacter]
MNTAGINAIEKLNAEVIAVSPDKVKISVDDLKAFSLADESLKVGSYLRISDNENVVLIGIIENFSIEITDDGRRSYLLEAHPLGIIKDDKFIRGGDSIAIPPKKVEPATVEDIKKIYENSVEIESNFCFSKLSSNPNISVPVDGNKFFNKHIAIVGSTGSGKSHTVSTILQKAISQKSGDFELNNSQIIIFDVHSEYKSAFPNANVLDIGSLVLPYWMLNSDELEDLFLDTEANDHNQRNVFKQAVVNNRKFHCGDPLKKAKIHYDFPSFFNLDQVLNYIRNRNDEGKDKDHRIIWEKPDGNSFDFSETTEFELFNDDVKCVTTTASGTLNGKLINFLNRLESKINDKRLDFILGEKSKEISFEETLKQLMGCSGDSISNVTVLDLSGVPFEVLSVTVSLISRIIFEYGYIYKRLRCDINPNETINNDVPILLVYEEAHKYVPKSDLVKFRASKQSIERIAKEGRKYGISLLLASQRPSEISETIFSQCNNFIAMRLTNPNDQSYVKKLLPDTLGNLINMMPAFKAGEGLLLGDAVVLPSIIQIDRCINPPSSNDIPYWKLWKEEWRDLDFEAIKQEWYK